MIDTLGWRAAFWINPPIAVAVICIAQRNIPESRSAAAGPPDRAGAALAVAAAAALGLGLGTLAEREPAPGRALALLAAGFVACVLYVRVERRAEEPLTPLGLFASLAFSGANLIDLSPQLGPR